MNLKTKICAYILAITLSLPTAYAAEVVETPTDTADAPSVVTEEKHELNKPEVTVIEVAPGLTEKIYRNWFEDGELTAYFLEADKNYYSLLPALDKDIIAGRDIVSNIAKEHGAVAGVNASYFATNGEILGVTRIDGKTVGTTYFQRTALGIRPDGSAHMGRIDYEGYVTINGVTLPVSGVNTECGENGTIVYNSFYGDTTKTNEYGMDYVIVDNKVVDIQLQNSEIPFDGVVVHVHGTSKEAFKDIMIGDRAEFFEYFKEPWNEDIHILGAGPRLVEDGQVNVTAAAEEFPRDIRVGRAPRTGFAITREGNYLFAVVDGRQKTSRGVTLTEFAELFRDFGAMDAMNFDGGGSSAMFINGEIVNSPSDGAERKVGDALLLLNR